MRAVFPARTLIFSLAGVRLGVSYSAVSAVGEADALINIGVEHAPGRCACVFPARTLRFSPVSALAAAAAVAVALALAREFS